MARANPIPNTYTNLTIETPQNITYSSNTIPVKFKAEGIIWTNEEDKVRNFTFSYILDGKEPEIIENITKISDEVVDVNVFLYAYNFTGNLILSNLTQGKHDIAIHQIINSSYYNPLNDSLAIANTQFMVDIHPSPTPSLTPSPSVPEFTIKYEAHPYYVAPTYTTDPYTGKSVESKAGYVEENQTIEFTIKTNLSSLPLTTKHTTYSMKFNTRDILKKHGMVLH